MSHGLGQLTPIFVEKATGDQMAPQLEEAHGGVDDTDPRLSNYVSWVGNRMLPYSLRGEDPHQYKVLKSDKIVNAFTLGNGSIYVTRGLLNMLEDESELAEVLGHENGHYGKRHIAKQIDKSVGIGLTLALAEGIYAARKGGNIPAGSQALIDQANSVIPALVLNGFGRDQEHEADDQGLKSMVAAGYDPMGGVRVFQRFQAMAPDHKGLEIFFDSHPTAGSRIEDITSRIQSSYPGVTGETGRDRYQSIVKGIGSPPAEFSGSSISPVAAGLIAAGLVAGTALVLL